MTIYIFWGRPCPMGHKPLSPAGFISSVWPPQSTARVMIAPRSLMVLAGNIPTEAGK